MHQHIKRRHPGAACVKEKTPTTGTSDARTQGDLESSVPKQSQKPTMFKIEGITWKRTLCRILEELNNRQFQKLLMEHLEKIPQSLKVSVSCSQMSQLIVEHYGEEKSIIHIHKAMNDIPRRDEAVMSLLLPYVHKVKELQRERTEARKLKNGTRTQTKTSADVPPRRHAEKIKRPATDDKDGSKALQVLQPAPVEPWRMSIRDLKRGDQLADKVLACKVVKKTALRTYRTQDNTKKWFFYLGVTDGTDSIKVMVYGGDQRYQELEEGNYFFFRDVLMEKDMIKLTSRSSVSRTTAFAVPERLEMEACLLLSPQCTPGSIAQAKMAADKSFVGVTGTVIAIEPLKHSKFRGQEKEFQELTLMDRADSISVCLWEDAVRQLDGLSLMDKVQVESTPHLSVLLVGIRIHNMSKMRLDAKVDDQVLTLMADPALVAEACGEQLDDHFEDKLLSKLPLSSIVELAGNDVKAMTTNT
uniref:uncharacterized protein LOC131138445 isoform X2 n=1 Tax=Doryrhamphus excisus TaxID=161450 RepID=UPI0025AE953D|nr:uncharacterized protein LOC131138445 isoform X2 [Doryrhamphus excisus]